MPESPPRRAPSARSPAAGCTIMIVAIASLAFLAGFAVWNLFKLDRELGRFTQQSPRPTPVPDLVTHAAEINVLNSKLETFQTDQGNARPAALSVTPEEINLAIAAFDPFRELRRTFSVRSIRNGRLHIAISFPLRGSPMKSGYRYLNGTMTASPRLADGEIVLDVEHIEVPGAHVPDGFIGQLSPYRLTERYRNHPTLGPWLARLTSVELTPDAVRLAVVPGDPAPSGGLPELAPRHLRRALALFAALALGFAAVAVYALRKGNRSTNPP